MIVVDANVLVSLALPSQLTPLAESLLVHHPVWFAPSLWRSEFRNVLARYLKKSVLTLSQALAIQDMIEEILAENTRDVASTTVLTLAASSGCTAYDCEYVALARHLKMPLVTMDAQVIKAFSDTAKPLTSFVSSYS